MDTRIGYPNEHLAGDSDDEIASPLYATAVGLLMNAVQSDAKNQQQESVDTEPEKVLAGEEAQAAGNTVQVKERKTIFDKWSEKLKDFLDNAE